MDVVGRHRQATVKGKVCILISPSSEFIVEVNVKTPAPGFTKILSKVTDELFPLVIVLL